MQLWKHLQNDRHETYKIYNVISQCIVHKENFFHWLVMIFKAKSSQTQYIELIEKGTAGKYTKKLILSLACQFLGHLFSSTLFTFNSSAHFHTISNILNSSIFEIKFLDILLSHHSQISWWVILTIFSFSALVQFLFNPA